MQSQWTNEGRIADDLERLKLRVRRSSSVPIPKEAALKLLEALKNPDVTTPELERIIGSDPSLALSILGASETDHGLTVTNHFTLHDAIIRLGTRALKAVALGTSFRFDPPIPTPGFDRRRFAVHSISVAFVAKYLFTKRSMSGELNSNLTADEVYSIGLLHDMGYVLLATVAPDVYGRILFMARRSQTTIAEGFNRLFQRDISELAPEFLCRWSHIQDLEHALSCLHQPWTYEEEYDALCCILGADYLVTSICSLATEDWPLRSDCPPEVLDIITLPDEELNLLTEAMNGHCARNLP